MKLEKWHGLTPSPSGSRGGFTLASIVHPRGTWYGLWDAKGKLALGEDHTVLLRFVDDHEIVLVRDALPAMAKAKAKAKPQVGWFFERWSLAGMHRRTRVDASKLYLQGAEPVQIELPKKYNDEVARIRVADQSAPFSFFVRDRVEPVGAFATVAELGGAPVPPERRAGDPATAPRELAKLARVSARLAAVVAGNRKAPAALIDELSTHASVDVRAAVARAWRLPPAVVRRLAEDRDARVRYEIASRIDRLDLETQQMVKRAPPPAVLRALANDADPRVRRQAAKCVDEPLDGARPLADQPLHLRLAAVQWGIPIERERRLARDPSAQVRLRLADSRHPRKCGRKPNIDGEALALLAADKSAKVRAAAALLTPYPPGTTTPPP